MNLQNLDENLKYALYMLALYTFSLLILNIINISSTGFDRNNFRGLGRVILLTCICVGVLKSHKASITGLYWGSFIIAFLSLIAVVSISFGMMSLSDLSLNLKFPILQKTLLVTMFFASAATAKFMYHYGKSKN